MAIKLAIVNQKGGVGKTALCANLSYGLATQLNKRVLLVDVDSQANSTMLYTSVVPDEDTINDVLKDKDYNPAEAIYQASIERGAVDVANLSIMPSNIDLDETAEIISARKFRESILKKQIAKVEHHFDLILFDCHGTLDILTVNAIATADKVIIPIDGSLESIKGVGDIFGTVSEVKQDDDFAEYIIINNMFEKRNAETNRLAEETCEPILKYFAKTKIRKSVDVKKAPYYGQPVFVYKPSSMVCSDLKKLVREIGGFE